MRRSSALVPRSQPDDLRFDPVSGSGTDHLVASRSRGSQLLGDTLHVPGGTPGPCPRRIARADRWPARSASARPSRHPVDRRTPPRPPHRQGVIQRLCINGSVGSRAVGRLQPQDPGGQRWIDRSAVNRQPLPPVVGPARNRRNRPAQRA